MKFFFSAVTYTVSASYVFSGALYTLYIYGARAGEFFFWPKLGILNSCRMFVVSNNASDGGNGLDSGNNRTGTGQPGTRAEADRETAID